MSVSKGIQGVRLFDALANGLEVVQVGADYVLGAAAKIRNAAGTVINPATEDTLLTIYSVLDAIKDTAGIKKIVDALPTGDNWLGRVKLGDGTNLVGQVLDGAAYRLLAAAKVARGATDLVNLDAIDTTSGQGRLKATLYTQDGDAVTFASVPANPTSIYDSFCLNGSSDNLLVDGSSTPIYFDYPAHSTYDVSLNEIAFAMASNSITFGSDYFGSTSGPLTNGVKVEITAGGNTGTAHTIRQNEDFVHFASPGGFSWVVSSKDMLSSVFVAGGGLKLKAGTSDKVRVTIQDDIDAAGAYFKCFVKGSLLA